MILCFFHLLAPMNYMSSFKYMGLKDLFLLTKKKMLSSISIRIIIISKAMTDTSKSKYELLEPSRGLWLSTIAFSMICRALTSHCPIFA